MKNISPVIPIVLSAAMTSACAGKILKPDNCEALKAHVQENSLAYKIGVGVVAGLFASTANNPDSDNDDWAAPVTIGIAAVGFTTLEEIEDVDCDDIFSHEGNNERPTVTFGDESQTNRLQLPEMNGM